MHCYNYHKKILLQRKNNYILSNEEKNKKVDFYSKKKSYSELLLKLTREQSQNFENGGFCLFGSRHPSISTINNSFKNYIEAQNDYINSPYNKKIIIKQVLKSQSKHNDFKHKNTNEYTLFLDDFEGTNQSVSKTMSSFLTENPFEGNSAKKKKCVSTIDRNYFIKDNSSLVKNSSGRNSIRNIEINELKGSIIS